MCCLLTSCRLLGSLAESGQIASVSELQDDQGINVDDEEAIAVEQGEFGKAAPPIRRSTKPVKAVQAVAKRPASASVPSSQEDLTNKKKKLKKA